MLKTVMDDFDPGCDKPPSNWHQIGINHDCQPGSRQASSPSQAVTVTFVTITITSTNTIPVIIADNRINFSQESGYIYLRVKLAQQS